MPEPGTSAGTAQGAAAEQLGGTILRLADRHLAGIKAREDADYVSTNFADLVARTSERMREAKANALPGAPGFATWFKAGTGADIDEILKKAPSSEAAQQFRTRATLFKVSADDEAVTFEAGEARKLHLDNIATAADRYGSAVAIDPKNLDGAIAAFSADATKVLGDIPPSDRSKIVNEGIARITKAAVWKMARDDPGGTLAQLKSGKWSEALGPEGTVWAIGQIDAELHRRQVEANALAAQRRQEEAIARAEWRDEIDRRERDITAQVEHGQAPKDMLSANDYARAYRSPGAARAAYETFQSNLQIAKNVASLSGMPTEQIVATLDSLGTKAKSSGKAEDYALADVYGRAAASALAARNKDPAAAVMSSAAAGEAAARYREANDQTGLFGFRVQAEAELGIAPDKRSWLTRAEAAGVVEQINAMEDKRKGVPLLAGLLFRLKDTGSGSRQPIADDQALAATVRTLVDAGAPGGIENVVGALMDGNDAQAIEMAPSVWGAKSDVRLPTDTQQEFDTWADQSRADVFARASAAAQVTGDQRELEQASRQVDLMLDTAKRLGGGAEAQRRAMQLFSPADYIADPDFGKVTPPKNVDPARLKQTLTDAIPIIVQRIDTAAIRDAALRQLPESDKALADEIAQANVARIVEDGIWVDDPEQRDTYRLAVREVAGDRVVLVYPIGRDGKPLTITAAEAEKLAAEAAKARAAEVPSVQDQGPAIRPLTPEELGLPPEEPPPDSPQAPEPPPESAPQKQSMLEDGMPPLAPVSWEIQSDEQGWVRYARASDGRAYTVVRDGKNRMVELRPETATA